jgi:hypothetical protein
MSAGGHAANGCQPSKVQSEQALCAFAQGQGEDPAYFVRITTRRGASSCAARYVEIRQRGNPTRFAGPTGETKEGS